MFIAAFDIHNSQTDNHCPLADEWAKYGVSVQWGVDPAAVKRIKVIHAIS